VIKERKLRAWFFETHIAQIVAIKYAEEVVIEHITPS
jgi:hypothetical protein